MDENKDTIEQMETDAGLQPILDGVQRIADSQTKTAKAIKTQIEEIDKKHERNHEDLESKFNKSMESVVERVERIRRSSQILGRELNIEPGDDQLKTLIDDTRKGLAGQYDHVGQVFSEKSALRRFEVHALTQEWFECTTKAALRRHASKAGILMARAEKIREALQEYHYGPNWQAIEKAAIGEDTGSGGSNLVPTVTEPEVQRLIKDAGDVFPAARQLSMTTKTHNVPDESTACTVAWVEEAGTISGGEPVFGQVALIAEKLAGRATMSYEVVNDSSPGLLPYLLTVFAEKMAGELDYQSVLGNGTTPQITGIINGSGINAITSGTAAGRSLTYALMVSTFTGASEKAARMDGVWICSPKGYTEILALTDSQGMPIVQFGNVPNAPAGSFLGRPIIVSARLGGSATLDDTTNTATKIIFGPLQKWIAGTRQGMEWDVTDQVNWTKYQVDARLVGRFAGNVGVPSAFTYLGQIAY